MSKQKQTEPECIGISYTCSSCKRVIQFSPLPNVLTDKWDRLVFGIYTARAKGGLCKTNCKGMEDEDE